ncbi:MAG: hypothetical protein ACREH6_06295, partial [Geminicoccaceae bacterium]
SPDRIGHGLAQDEIRPQSCLAAAGVALAAWRRVAALENRIASERLIASPISRHHGANGERVDR